MGIVSRLRWVRVFVVVVLVGVGVWVFGGVGGRGRVLVAWASAGTSVGGSSYVVPSGAVVVSPSGSDSAVGSVGAPLRTLGRAIAVAGSGSTIVLRAGSYHESVVIPSSKRLTVQSWPGEAVWLDGSVPVSGWSASGGLWRTAWSVKFDHSPTYTRGASDNTAANWGFVNPAYPMAAHPDQVWVGGVAQRQMASKSQVGAGSFYYDEAGKTLWLGTNPSGTSVRASSLVQAMRIDSASSVVRGLGIRRFAPSVPDMGAVTVEKPNVTVENVAITDSATTALHVGAGSSTISGVTLRNVYVANSGMLGISATYADGLTLDQVVSEHNNVEHFNTAPVSGGFKIARTRGISITNSVFRNNDGPGVWIDESSYNVTIDHNDVRDNTKHGIVARDLGQGRGHEQHRRRQRRVRHQGEQHQLGHRLEQHVRRQRRPQHQPRARHPPPTSATTAGRDKRQPFPDPTMTWLLGPVTVNNNTIANQHGGTCLLCVEDYSQQRSAAQIGVTANNDRYTQPPSSIPYLIVWSRGPGNPDVYNTLTSFHTATGQEANGTMINSTDLPTTTTTKATTTTKPTATTQPTVTTQPTTTTTKPKATTTTTKPPAQPDGQPAVVASDTFDRAIWDGFGTADEGGAWTTSPPASFSVWSGDGSHRRSTGRGPGGATSVRSRRPATSGPTSRSTRCRAVAGRTSR